jgi:hypothetical protein
VSERTYSNKDTDLLCTSHVAKYYHCDTETIRKGIKQGIIRAVKAEDGFLWIPRSELKRIKILPPGYPHRVRVRPGYKEPVINETMVAEANTEYNTRRLDAEWLETEESDAAGSEADPFVS